MENNLSLWFVINRLDAIQNAQARRSGLVIKT